MLNLKTSIRLFMFALLLHTHAAAAYAKAQFDVTNWKVSETGVEIIKNADHDVVKIVSGKMTWIPEQFENGIIEFEMKSSGERAFIFANFREGDGQHEEVYVRTHKSNAPDALQYTPVFQGRSAWQIYHGNKGTAAATIPANEWIKVKVDVHDDVLNMWVGDVSEAQLKNVPLTGTQQSGAVSFRGLVPNNSPAPYSALLRNIRIRPSETAFKRESKAAITPSPYIKELLVSQIFEASKEPVVDIPKSVKENDWSPVNAESDGIFEFLRWREIPANMRNYAVVTQTYLMADKAVTCQLDLGFSDAVSVLINDQIISHSNMSFRYGNNRQQGVLHSQQLSVFVPLQAGDNKLEMVVSDSFGGWGLQASLSDCGDVEISI